MKKLGVINPPERMLRDSLRYTDPGQVDNLWDQAIQKFSRVDIWVNNAGVASPVSDAWNVHREDIESVIDTNLKGAILRNQCSRARNARPGIRGGL